MKYINIDLNMSRIRIVGGKITKHTVGSHNMYAEESIVFHSDKAIFEKGEEKGVTYGKPKKAPPVAKSLLKCVVEFRPSKDWKGEFGFDWNRKSDSQMPVDEKYSDVVGKYGTLYATNPKAVFTQNNSLYFKHLLEYEMFVVDGYSRYYVPNMTLMKNEKAVLDAVIEISEQPDSMRYEYDKNIFQITILEKLSNKKGKHYNDKVIEIKCLKEFSSLQKIELIATKDKINKKVGQINILPNNIVKDVNVVFIPVEHNGYIGSVKGNEIQILINAFKQSYINGKIKPEKKGIKIGDWWFDLFFTTKDKKGKVLMDTSNLRSIHRALDDKFFEDKKNDIYKDYYRLYMLPDGTLNGVAEDIGGNAKVVVVYQNRNDSTAPHELMHAMGLYHTFDNDGKFTYKLHKTDNIMDYTHQVGKSRFSTNKWQWKILNSNM